MPADPAERVPLRRALFPQRGVFVIGRDPSGATEPVVFLAGRAYFTLLCPPLCARHPEFEVRRPSL